MFKVMILQCKVIIFCTFVLVVSELTGIKKKKKNALIFCEQEMVGI